MEKGNYKKHTCIIKHFTKKNYLLGGGGLHKTVSIVVLLSNLVVMCKVSASYTCLRVQATLFLPRPPEARSVIGASVIEPPPPP